jgi:hypothetical protein
MPRRRDYHKARILTLAAEALEGASVYQDEADHGEKFHISSEDSSSLLVKAEVPKRHPRYFILKVIEPV